MSDNSVNLLNQAIDEVAAATRIRAFVPEYREKVSDAEALGVAIAGWAHWDGEKIVEAFLSALEDANFHAARAQFEAIWAEEVAG